MNASQMKSHSAAKEVTASNGFTGIHWLMTVIGIAAAIICSVVLLTQEQPDQDDRTPSSYVNASTSSLVDQIKTEAHFGAFEILAKF
jgi:hypothetical protein